MQFLKGIYTLNLCRIVERLSNVFTWFYDLKILKNVNLLFNNNNYI